MGVFFFVFMFMRCFEIEIKSIDDNECLGKLQECYLGVMIDGVCDVEVMYFCVCVVNYFLFCEVVFVSFSGSLDFGVKMLSL